VLFKEGCLIKPTVLRLLNLSDVPRRWLDVKLWLVQNLVWNQAKKVQRFAIRAGTAAVATAGSGTNK
jgi:hypothetical protein